MKPRIYVDFNRHVGDNLYWLGADDAWQLKPYYELGWLRHESEVCFFDDEGMEALGCLEYVERDKGWWARIDPNTIRYEVPVSESFAQYVDASPETRLAILRWQMLSALSRIEVDVYTLRLAEAEPDNYPRQTVADTLDHLQSIGRDLKTITELLTIQPSAGNDRTRSAGKD